MRSTTTRRRVRLATTIAAAAGLLPIVTACQPEPPAPAPTIISASATPGVAGQPITFTVVASHANVIPNYLGYADAQGPSKAEFPRSSETDACFPATADFPGGPGPGTSTLTLTCTLPTTTLNGDWTVSLWVGANGYAGRRTTIPFTVTGGVDDNSGPVVTVLTPHPQQLTRGQTFPIRYRMEDPHIGSNLGLHGDTFERKGLFVPYSSFGCYTFVGGDFLIEQVSPTAVEVSYTCTVPMGIEPGEYRTEQFATDIYGFRTHIPLVVVVS